MWRELNSTDSIKHNLEWKRGKIWFSTRKPSVLIFLLVVVIMAIDSELTDMYCKQLLLQYYAVIEFEAKPV